MFSLLPPKYVQASIVCSIGALLFGIDTGTIGPVTVMPEFVKTFGSLSSTVHGAVVSSILIPAATASFFAGHLADRVGRVRGMALGGAIYGVGSSVEAAAVHISMFVIGRAIAGVGEGLFLSTIVVYICEISPPLYRGRLCSIPQFMIALGVVSGYFVCYGSVDILSSLSWRLPFAIHALVAFSFMTSSLLFLPQSPRWLSAAGRYEEAASTWNGLGISLSDREKDGNIEDGNIRANTQELVLGVELMAHISTPGSVLIKEDVGGFLRVFQKDVRRRTIMGMFLQGMQQLSGIDGVLYYAPLLFQQAGLKSSQSSFLASGVSALVIFAITIPAALLADHWGRRTSTLTGGIGLAICMTMMGALYASDSVKPTAGAGRWVVVVLIFLFAGIFSATWAICIKIYASEIQPPHTRAAATSLGQSSNWIVNFLVALTTPIFLAHSTYGVYFLFGAASFVTVLVCLVAMPETKGKSLEDIDAAFKGKPVHASSSGTDIELV